VLAVAAWSSMLYTACCMAEPTMYPPYHREVVAAELMVLNDAVQHGVPPQSGRLDQRDPDPSQMPADVLPGGNVA
jgi:hypothetical protein